MHTRIRHGCIRNAVRSYQVVCVLVSRDTDLLWQQQAWGLLGQDNADQWAWNGNDLHGITPHSDISVRTCGLIRIRGP